MRSFRIALLLIPLFANSIFAQDTLTYKISFPNAIHHEAEISLSLKNIDSGNIKAIMSKTSPGRYAIHDFGKNVYNIRANDSTRTELNIMRIEPDVWNISNIQSEVTIQYTLFANHADGTYSGIDSDFANLNMPSTMMWIEKTELYPMKVIFDLPDTSTWKIATQLTLLDSVTNTYFSPDLQYLMDSPCILGNLKSKAFQSKADSTITFNMAFNTNAEEEELNRFNLMTQKVIDEQMAIFGEFPDFNEHTYHFLCSYGPGFHGDGMEHRNSTMISSSIPLTGNQNRLIGTVSHEFFHVWNVERIRPASLEPFNFTKPNVSGELWFAEGFTSYYGDLMLCRAGITSPERYINSLSALVNYCVNAPGWTFGSPVEMSEFATYADQSAFVDETNFSNTFLSYYNYGELIALALDLRLRTEFQNISLDKLMKAMWIKYGKTELPYTNTDIENTLAEVCNDSEFARDFFRRHIFGNELPDFVSIFDKIGYKLIKKNPERPGLGYLRMKFEGDTAILLSPTLIGTGLYDAGVNKGDLILSIDGQPVTSYPELNFIISTRKVGDELEVQYSNLGKLKKGNFKLKEENQLVLVPKEKFSIRLNEEEEKARNTWLSSSRK